MGQQSGAGDLFDIFLHFLMHHKQKGLYAKTNYLKKQIKYASIKVK